MLKRLRFLLATLLVFFSTVIAALPAVAAPTNLIANPSVETVAAGNPSNWTADKWGTNTAVLTHEVTGYTGTRSLRTEVTAYTSGDAKWIADDITVTPSTSYTYTSYYKSNVDTEIDLRYQDAAGNITYAYAQWVPASVDWAPLTVTFTTPATATKVAPLHIIAKTGWLQTDEFSLSTAEAEPIPTGDNLIANASFETAAGLKPAKWLTNNWGANTANFVYENTGRTGSHSVTTNVSAFTTGDAKWYAEPVAVTAGNNYTYTDYYKSTIASRAVVAYINAAGVYSFAEIGTAPASADWAPFSTAFTAPAGTVQVSVFHIIEQIGSLSLDDVSLTETVVTPPTDDENIVPNPSLENLNGAQPANWVNNNWGVNTSSFTYAATGRTGNRSVTTTTTAYTNGDAKWYFQPADVVANKLYVYRDYYKSTIASRVVAAFSDAAGVTTYKEIGAVAASADWKLFEASVTMPATAVKATVFHIIEGVGSLTIDDVLLQVAVPAGADISVPNGSLENGVTTPTGWNASSWGTNTPTFTYMNEGRTGTKSIRVSVNNYTDGDAKWFFDPITTLTPGQQYRFTTWYKGTALPHVVALYIMEDNTERYVGLPSPLTINATEWQKYSDTFTVPEGAKQVSLFMYVAGNGWLQTDDYTITSYHPSAFNRPLLTLTFDDGHEDNATTALPLLNQYGFKSTQCYATSFIEGQSQAVRDGVLAFFNSGHEICSHTVTHPFLTTLTNPNLTYELSHSKTYLESLIGQPVRNFASPYGDYNAAVNDVIDNYYQSHRTVDEGFNSKDNFNIYRLRVQNILDTTTASQVAAWIEQAQADKTWLILVYHRVANNPGPYDSYTNIFAEHLQAIANSGIVVKTYQDALTEVLPQL